MGFKNYAESADRFQSTRSGFSPSAPLIDKDEIGPEFEGELYRLAFAGIERLKKRTGH